MSRYVTYAAGPAKPARAVECGDDELWSEASTTIDVIEVDHAHVDTGLLDADGRKLFRVADRVTIGFPR